MHDAGKNEKYCIEAIDSVIGANSAQLRLKILGQIPDDPRKTKQISSNLRLSVGERTEIALDVRVDDGMNNGAGNVIKKIQLNQQNKSYGYNMDTVRSS